jgi:biopolymer transport protein ExbD
MKRFDQINMIPFIDIMLVLLAIVLTTATFISQGVIEIDLPVAENTGILGETETKSLEIAINADNGLFLDGASTTQQQLSDKLKDLDKQTSVILRVDKEVAFQYFVGVVDLLKKHKLEKLKIITKDGI